MSIFFISMQSSFMQKIKMWVWGGGVGANSETLLLVLMFQIMQHTTANL